MVDERPCAHPDRVKPGTDQDLNIRSINAATGSSYATSCSTQTATFKAPEHPKDPPEYETPEPTSAGSGVSYLLRDHMEPPTGFERATSLLFSTVGSPAPDIPVFNSAAARCCAPAHPNLGWPARRPCDHKLRLGWPACRASARLCGIEVGESGAEVGVHRPISC